MGQSRKRAETGARRLPVDTDRPRGGVGGGGVLGIVLARQRPGLVEVQHQLPVAGRQLVVKLAVLGEYAARDRCPAGNRNGTFYAARREIGEDAAAVVVIDAGDRRLSRPLAAKDPALGGHVAGHVAVTIEMIGGDVEKHRHVEHHGGVELQLKRRQLQDIGSVACERTERQHRRSEIAAHLARASGRPQDVTDQGGGRGFSVGAGDADVGGVRLGAVEQFAIADDRAARGARAAYHGMRLRMREGDARTGHQGLGLLQVAVVKVHQRDPGRGGGVAVLRIIVPGPDRGVAVGQRAGGGHAGHPEPEDGDGLIGEEGQFDHRFLTATSTWTARPAPGWRR